MARSVPAALLTFLQSNPRWTAPALITIRTRSGTVLHRITSHYADLVNGPDTYTAVGLNMSEIEIGINETPASAEFEVSLVNGSPITADNVENRVYEGARCEIATCDPDNVAASFLTLTKYRVGTVRGSSNELRATFSLGGNLSGTTGSITVERYSPECRALLGDHRCTVPVLPGEGITHITERQNSTAYALGDYIRVFQSGSWDNRNYLCTTAGTSAGTQPAFDTTVGNTTADGTAVFTAEQAWAREADVVSQTGQAVEVTVTESRAVDDTWFELGRMHFIDGANAGLDPIDILAWDNTNKIATLIHAPIFQMQANDKVFLVPGCDHRLATCSTKFSNNLNFVGEPYTSPFGIVSFAQSL